jgi:hypothetical protein
VAIETFTWRGGIPKRQRAGQQHDESRKIGPDVTDPVYPAIEDPVYLGIEAEFPSDEDRDESVSEKGSSTRSN